MKKRTWWVGMIIGVMGLAGASTTFATEVPFQQGSWELKINSDFDSMYKPFIEYYVLNNLAIFATGAYDRTEIEISGVTDTTTESRLGIGLEFNIPTGAAIVPFLSAAIENVSLKEDDGTSVTKIDGPALDLSGGIKIMVGNRASVNLGVTYVISSLDTTVNGTTDTADVKDLAGELGFSLYF